MWWHAQQPDFVFGPNGRVRLNRGGGRQFIRLLATEVCASAVVDCVWNVIARAETRFRLSAKQASLFKSGGGHQFSRLLAGKLCVSAVVMLDTPCSEVVRRVLATYSICQFPLHPPSCASPCAITFQPESKCRNLQGHFAYAILRSSRYRGDHSCSSLFQVRFDVL
jgi:hypothetical protein